jgi:hypothetical protein
VNNILIRSGILVAALLPAIACGHPSSAVAGPKVPFSIHLPSGWTPIQPDAPDMARRWTQAGIPQAQAQATIAQAARHHGLFAVANHSRAHSSSGMVTSLALDCARGPGKSPSAQLAVWRHSLKTTSGAQSGAESLNGRPAAWLSYPMPGGQPGLHRVAEYVQGHSMSCFAALTTDQLSRYKPDFDQALNSLRIP